MDKINSKFYEFLRAHHVFGPIIALPYNRFKVRCESCEESFNNPRIHVLRKHLTSAKHAARRRVAAARGLSKKETVQRNKLLRMFDFLRFVNCGLICVYCKLVFSCGASPSMISNHEKCRKHQELKMAAKSGESNDPMRRRREICSFAPPSLPAAPSPSTPITASIPSTLFGAIDFSLKKSSRSSLSSLDSMPSSPDAASLYSNSSRSSISSSSSSSSSYHMISTDDECSNRSWPTTRSNSICTMYDHHHHNIDNDNDNNLAVTDHHHHHHHHHDDHHCEAQQQTFTLPAVAYPGVIWYSCKNGTVRQIPVELNLNS